MNRWYNFGCIVFLTGLISCQHEPIEPITRVRGGYPEHIAKVILPKCATSGCHDDHSHQAAGGLNLTTWSAMMRGSRNNSVVVPFRPDYSPLFFSINHLEALAPTLAPRMPLQDDPLSDSELFTLYEWIAEGAPNHQSKTILDTIPVDRRLFVLNTLCKNVSVLDAKTGLVIGYFDLPVDGSEGAASALIVDKSRNQFFVLFTSGITRSYAMETGQQIRSTDLGLGAWRSLRKADDQTLIAVDWSGNTSFGGGKVATIELDGLQAEITSFTADSVFFPIDIAIADDGLYTCAYLGNYVMKMKRSGEHWVLDKRILLEGHTANPNEGRLRPSSLIVVGDKLLVGCERTGELKIIDDSTDEVIETMDIGNGPHRFEHVAEEGLLFISCMEDRSISGEGKGSVWVLDVASFEVINHFYSGYQPHEMKYIPSERTVYICNRNVDPVGADAPHHYTECEGNNGYLTRYLLDHQSFDTRFKAECSVDPAYIDY